MKKILFVLTLFLILGCTESRDSAGAASPADGKGGSMATFILKNNYLYTVDQMNLNVFSIADQTNPVKVNSVNVGFNIETVFSMGDYLFIGSRNGMFIFSIAQNPEVPQHVSQAQHFTACDPVVANKDYAFVTLHTNSVCNPNISINKLMVYNITNITTPQLIASRDLQEPKGIALYGNYLFLCDKTDILVFDVTNPQNMVLKKTIANVPAIDIIIDGNHMLAFTKTAVYQFDIDPANVTNISKVSEFALN